MILYSYVNGYQRVNPIKPHQKPPLSYGSPMVFGPSIGIETDLPVDLPPPPPPPHRAGRRPRLLRGFRRWSSSAPRRTQGWRPACCGKSLNSASADDEDDGRLAMISHFLVMKSMEQFQHFYSKWMINRIYRYNLEI